MERVGGGDVRGWWRVEAVCFERMPGDEMAKVRVLLRVFRETHVDVVSVTKTENNGHHAAHG